ncbi:pimeloyl-ACP methyl ester carboxylesterase [Catenulispora sp. EB89]
MTDGGIVTGEPPAESPPELGVPSPSGPASYRMHVHRSGRGPLVLLLHGGLRGGQAGWRHQHPLTRRWTLLAPDRPGHGESPPARQDFESESVLVAHQLLDRPVHVVGMSYGAIVAMYAAALRPDNVRSLTLVEPPCTAVAAGVPAVDAYGEEVRRVLELRDATDADALREFLAVVGAPAEVSEPIPPSLRKGLRQLLGARPPDEAEPPLAQLRAAPFHTLVVSGGHLEANEIICDVIAAETAGSRAVCPGAGHLIPDTGKPFNDLLERHFRAAGGEASEVC